MQACGKKDNRLYWNIFLYASLWKAGCKQTDKTRLFYKSPMLIGLSFFFLSKTEDKPMCVAKVLN